MPTNSFEVNTSLLGFSFIRMDESWTVGDIFLPFSLIWKRNQHKYNFSILKQKQIFGQLNDSSFVYIEQDRGRIYFEIFSAEGIPDPLGEIFYLKKVVIALYVFVWQFYCWYIYFVVV